MKTPVAKKTQIICTLGPASRRKDTIVKMAKAGMAIARINFSHGELEDHQNLINTIREVNAQHKFKIKILQDLEGYRIRIGNLVRPFNLIKYQHIWMAKGESQDQGIIPLESEFDLSDLKVGMEIFVDDGRIHLRVEELTTVNAHPVLRMEVLNGGVINSRKGVNIPQLRLKVDILTVKDQRDIEFGIRNKMDFIAQSFVRNKKDIDRVTALVRPTLPECQIIAKIENQEGLRNLDSIMDHSDGIMVARGDLGVSLPIYKIPVIQKDIIRRCNRRKKMVITATQMLESMTDNVRPTRAEVSDVANAIIDGTDYVMLSGETAAGCYPVKAVRMMHMIIAYTEKSLAQSPSKARRF